MACELDCPHSEALPNRLRRLQEAFWQRMRAAAASPAAADAALASYLIKLIAAPGIDSRSCLTEALGRIGTKVRPCSPPRTQTTGHM